MDFFRTIERKAIFLTNLNGLKLTCVAEEGSIPVNLNLDKNRFFYMINKLLYNACQRSKKGQELTV